MWAMQMRRVFQMTISTLSEKKLHTNAVGHSQAKDKPPGEKPRHDGVFAPTTKTTQLF
jgi:hypothetical protein